MQCALCSGLLKARLGAISPHVGGADHDVIVCYRRSGAAPGIDTTPLARLQPASYRFPTVCIPLSVTHRRNRKCRDTWPIFPRPYLWHSFTAVEPWLPQDAILLVQTANKAWDNFLRSPSILGYLFEASFMSNVCVINIMATINFN